MVDVHCLEKFLLILLWDFLLRLLLQLLGLFLLMFFIRLLLSFCLFLFLKILLLNRFLLFFSLRLSMNNRFFLNFRFRNHLNLFFLYYFFFLLFVFNVILLINTLSIRFFDALFLLFFKWKSFDFEWLRKLMFFELYFLLNLTNCRLIFFTIQSEKILLILLHGFVLFLFRFLFFLFFRQLCFFS